MLVYTSCTNNYIPKARVLASTLKTFHPDWTFCLLLGETPPEGFALKNEPFDRLMTFDQLDIPEYPSWLFRHRVVEICTAAKGPALVHFLEREGHEKVIYLDPDIMVCNTLAPLDTLLDAHDLLLTPHLLAPQKTPQSIEDNELCALRHGVFNLGFAAVARRGDGAAFARWWRDRLLNYCYDDIPKGIFTDQRWCDLAPAFFPNLHVVRDPGCNAASWNLTDRTITKDSNGTFYANEKPLRFYHFTGFDSGAGDGMTARYAEHMPAVNELWALYKKRLMASGHAVLGEKRWKHMTFNDGTPITDAMRLLYRNREDLRTAFPDPFERPGFLDWHLTEHAPKNSENNPKRRAPLAMARKVKQLLDMHGGFPHGVPGLARHIAERIRHVGFLGAARKLWHSSTEEGQHHVAPVEKLPLLRDVLSNAENAGNPEAAKLLRILDPTHAPICIVEHDWGGGADVYCRERVASLLAEGRAVIRLRYVLASSQLELTVCLGEESFRCALNDVRDLMDKRFPHIKNIVVNEMAGWHHRPADPAWTAARVLDSVQGIAQVARHHEAHLEILFHDYYAVCPTINLLTPEGVYCGLEGTAETCDACALRGDPFSLEGWRSVWGELLALADTVVFFSENTRDAVCGVYALHKEQITVRPHTVKPLGPKLRIPVDGPMRVAIVGNIQQHKGAGIVMDLARLLEKAMPQAAIVVFGTLEAPHSSKNITVLGPYSREDLPRLMELHKITAGLFPSICPETFSFVAHELVEIGVPLVSFDIGAQGAYVRTLPNSCVVSEINAGAALVALKNLDSARIARTIS